MSRQSVHTPLIHSPRCQAAMPLRSFRLLLYGMFFALLLGLGGWIALAYETPLLTWMQHNQQILQQQAASAPLASAMLYTLLFTLVLGFYIPGGILLMLLAGAIFPFWEANVIANLGNLLGATIGFFLSRSLLRHEVQMHFGERLRPINMGVQRHGWLYLLVVRIAPVIPSPLVNLGMGLTPMRARTYIWVTLLGRLPMTCLYVHLGAELAEIEQLSDMLSPDILATLLALAAIMLGAHIVWLRIQRRRPKAAPPAVS